MTTAADRSPLGPVDPGRTAEPAPRPSVMISPEGERALRKQLDELLRKRDEELPQRLQDVREFGAGSENDDFLQILEEEAIVEARIRSIQGVLASAKVVDPDAASAGVAGIGSVVTLRMNGREVERRLTGAHEPVGIDGVSAASPIGQAILGSGPGETVTAELPGGKLVEIEIVSVDGRSGLDEAAADGVAGQIDAVA